MLCIETWVREMEIYYQIVWSVTHTGGRISNPDWLKAVPLHRPKKDLDLVIFTRGSTFNGVVNHTTPCVKGIGSWMTTQHILGIIALSSVALVVFSAVGTYGYGSTWYCVVKSTPPQPQSWTCDGEDVAHHIPVHLGAGELKEHVIDTAKLGDGLYPNNACMTWRITTARQQVRKSGFFLFLLARF